MVTTARRQRKPFQIRGTFDIETHDWDCFAIGATYDGHRPKVWYSGDEMIDYMRKLGGVWWAHAMGVYDGLYVLERFRERGITCQIDRSQHRVTRIVAGGFTARDSYALWPVPLDDIAGAIGESVPKLPWRCTCGHKCGGFCQIGERAKQGDPDLEEYVKADCKVLYRGIHELVDFAEDNAIDLRGTLGQTAWQSAQDELGVPDSTMPWELWRHAKRADKPGRVEIIRPKARGPGRHHDICNAYPAQLATLPLPIGGCRQLGPSDATLALGNLKPGIYTCSVRVPDDLLIPPLPWSVNRQVWYPTGAFTGTWVLPELIAAFERGTMLDKVHGGLVWEASDTIFAPLVRRWYDIRRAIGRKTPYGQWIGRLAKAFTGKLAEKPDRSRVTMHPDSIKVCLRKGQCRDGCTRRCGAYEQLDLFGHIYAIPYSYLGPSAYPQWSAYLRAATRVQWMTQAERFGRDLAFGNTDSLFSIGRMQPEPLGDDLGQWEFQGGWQELEIRSATNYAYRDSRTKKLVLKGVPGLTEADWRRGRGVIDRGVVTFGNAVKSTRGLFSKRSRKWSLPVDGADRVMYGDRRLGDGGITYPLDADEIRELARAKANT